MRRVALPLLAVLLLSACDEEFSGFGGGGLTSSDIRAASGGKVDPSDPGKTLTTAMSGETVGNTEQDPALATTKGGQEYLDARGQFVKELDAEQKGQPPDWGGVVLSADRALRATPKDAAHAEQRSRTLELRAMAHAREEARAQSQLERSIQRGQQDAPAAQSALENGLNAGNDYREAADSTKAGARKGDLYAAAANAYSRTGRVTAACEMAEQAIRALANDANIQEMVTLRQELGCRR